MCLLFVYVNKDPDENGYKMILASNRDEFWPRPTDIANFRDNFKWFGGSDLEPGKEGGTWLGISTTGKVAILLNILAKQNPSAKGRGSLVRNFLTGDLSCEEYLEDISSSASEFNPFHLLLLDLRNDCNLHCLSSCQNKVQTVTKLPGVHAGDNSICLDAPWKKTKEGQRIFTDILKEYGCKEDKDELVSKILDFLNIKTQYFPDEKIAEQFRDAGKKLVGDLMQQLSSRFVFCPEAQYGTRTNTVILVDSQGNCDYIERTMETPVNVENPSWNTVKHQFTLNGHL